MLEFEQIEALDKRFDAIVMKGIEENPQSLNPGKQGKRGKNSKTKARNLLDRLTEHKEKTQRFLTDLEVPFENQRLYYSGCCAYRILLHCTTIKIKGKL